MKKLVWKELREWGPLTAALLVVLCLSWCLAGSVEDVLIAPKEEPTLTVLATACFFGLLLGYGQLSAERARGTLPYLAHREGGKRALLRGKLAVGIPLALAVGMLPPLVYLARESYGVYATVLQPARGFEHALAGLVALPAYASGLFVALVAPSVFLRFALGLLACAGCFLYSLWLPLPVFRMSPLAIPLFALGQIALAAAVLALAWSFFARGHDRDAVLPFRMQVGSACFALLLFVFPAWYAFNTSVREAQQTLFNGYPLVVRYTDGHYASMERSEFDARVRDGTPGQTTFTLPDGTVITEPNPALAYNPSAPVEVPLSLRNGLFFRARGWLTDPQRWQQLTVSRFLSERVNVLDKDDRPIHPGPSAGSVTRFGVYCDRESGTVRQFVDPRIWNAPANAAIELPRPDGRRFSGATLVVIDDMQAPLLVDRGDWTLWMVDFAEQEGRLAQLSLPGNDRFVDLQSGRAASVDGWTSLDWIQPVFVGERGRYQWTSTGFEAEGSFATRPWWIRHCRSEVGETTLTEMTTRLRNLDEEGNVPPETAVAFVQRYEPRSLGERARAAAMRVGMLCGPPVLSAQRLIADSSAPLLRGLLPSPATMPKDSNAVHGAHVLLGILLGVLTWRHVARRGGARAEQVLWSAFALLFGVFALCFLLMLAPRPARESAESTAEEHAARSSSTLATT